MIYTFITSEDLEVAIKDDFLGQIQPEPKRRAEAIRSAIDYMKSFMNNRYLMVDNFPNILAWDATKNYKVAVEETYTDYDVLDQPVIKTRTPIYYRSANGFIQNVVYRLGTFYVAKTDNTNKAPESNTDDWEESDPRNMLLVRMCVDVALFYLHARINPRKIPSLRTDCYNQAKEWLMMVKDGDITPELPRPIDKQENVDTIPWGSNRKQQQVY